MTMTFLNSDWFRRFIASSNRTTCPKIDIHCHLNTEINHLISHTIQATLCYSINLQSP